MYDNQRSQQQELDLVDEVSHEDGGQIDEFIKDTTEGPGKSVMANSLEMDSFDVVDDDNYANPLHRTTTTREKSFPSMITGDSRTDDDDNPLRRSARSNAMYPQVSSSIEVMRPKKQKKMQRHSQGLNQSAYIRNDNAFSIIQKELATGSSVIGQSQSTQNTIQNLAKLVGNVNAFEQAFNQSMVVAPSKPNDLKLQESCIGHPLNKIDVLLESSRKFSIGDREYIFDEEESIFFMEGPINPRAYHNTSEGCNTCAVPWKKASDLVNSHCTFCGMSSCKSCMSKSRCFQPDKSGQKELDKSGREIKIRGTICKLCDRKFLVKEMIHTTLTEITTHNQVLTNALSQQEGFKKEIAELEGVREEQTGGKKHSLKTVKQGIRKLKEEFVELKTNYDDLQDEYESGRRKEEIIVEKRDQLNNYIEEMEEKVSEKIVHLKEIKEQLEEANLLFTQIEEQLSKLTRTGRQPLNKSSRQGGSGKNGGAKPTRTNRSFDDDDEDQSGRGSITIPEDDYELKLSGKLGASTEGKFEEPDLAVSPQTRDTYIEQTRLVQERSLSVIISEHEEGSVYFEESEEESQYVTDEALTDTLANGKSTSKQKQSKRKLKQEKRIKKKEKHIGKAAMCGGGSSDKACCTIF